MSRKTEPRGIVPSKKGDCPACGGTGLSQVQVNDLPTEDSEPSVGHSEAQS